MRQAERILQREVMARLRFAPVKALVVPSPNGIYLPARTPAEKVLAARVVHQLKLDGQILPGAPDLLVLWSHGCGGIELKRPAERNLLGKQAAGQLSPTQTAFRDRCDELGVHYAVCQSWDEVRETLKAWGRLPATYQDADRRIGRAA
jgi:hypothetical protein